MRVLVVENDKVTLLGQIGVALEEAGAEIDICRPHAGDAIPADDKENARLIVMRVILETFRALQQSYPKISPEQAKDLRRIRARLAK